MQVTATINLDFVNDEGKLDEIILDELVSKIVSDLKDKLSAQVEKKCLEAMDEQLTSFSEIIGKKLNDIMQNFFETPKNITDKYGNITRKDVTPLQLLTEACDKFFDTPLDSYGKPATPGSYGVKYLNRYEYMINNSIGPELESRVRNMVAEIEKKMKETISSEVKTHIGDKMAELLKIDSILNKK